MDTPTYIRLLEQWAAEAKARGDEEHERLYREEAERLRKALSRRLAA